MWAAASQAWWKIPCDFAHSPSPWQPGMQALGAWSLLSEQRGTGGLGEWEAASAEMLTHLLQRCSHCELLFTSPCRTAQPVPALSQEPALPWVPILHSPGCQHSCCSFPHCSVAKVMLLGRSEWCRLWFGSAWESAHDGNGHCRSCFVHGSGMAATTPPSPLPQTSWAFCSRASLAPCVCRRNFPLGKVVCIFALIRLQRNAKGAREMKHVLSQPNRQINTGKKSQSLWPNELRPALELKWKLKKT